MLFVCVFVFVCMLLLIYHYFIWSVRLFVVLKKLKFSIRLNSVCVKYKTQNRFCGSTFLFSSFICTIHLYLLFFSMKYMALCVCVLMLPLTTTSCHLFQFSSVAFNAMFKKVYANLD